MAAPPPYGSIVPVVVPPHKSTTRQYLPPGRYSDVGLYQTGSSTPDFVVIELPPPPIFGREPVEMVCPSCQRDISTVIVYRDGKLVYILCLCLFIFTGICCFYPFFINALRDAEHYCPRSDSACRDPIGRSSATWSQCWCSEEWLTQSEHMNQRRWASLHQTFKIWLLYISFHLHLSKTEDIQTSLLWDNHKLLQTFYQLWISNEMISLLHTDNFLVVIPLRSGDQCKRGLSQLIWLMKRRFSRLPHFLCQLR